MFSSPTRRPRQLLYLDYESTVAGYVKDDITGASPLPPTPPKWTPRDRINFLYVRSGCLANWEGLGSLLKNKTFGFVEMELDDRGFNNQQFQHWIKTNEPRLMLESLLRSHRRAPPHKPFILCIRRMNDPTDGSVVVDMTNTITEPNERVVYHSSIASCVLSRWLRWTVA